MKRWISELFQNKDRSEDQVEEQVEEQPDKTKRKLDYLEHVSKATNKLVETMDSFNKYADTIQENQQYEEDGNVQNFVQKISHGSEGVAIKEHRQELEHVQKKLTEFKEDFEKNPLEISIKIDNVMEETMGFVPIIQDATTVVSNVQGAKNQIFDESSAKEPYKAELTTLEIFQHPESGKLELNPITYVEHFPLTGECPKLTTISEIVDQNLGTSIQQQQVPCCFLPPEPSNDTPSRVFSTISSVKEYNSEVDDLTNSKSPQNSSRDGQIFSQSDNDDENTSSNLWQQTLDIIVTTAENLPSDD